MSKKFIELKKYGQLYVDKIFFESYFPIIFTCKNNDGKVFICVCCQNNEKGCKWLIGKTNGLNIIKMLEDKITIRQLLLEYSSEKISVDYVKDEYTITYNNSDWNEDSPYLPKKDSYMYAEEGEFDDEIAYYSSMECPIEYTYDDKGCHDDISNIIETINKKIDLNVKNARVFLDDSIISPEKILSTLEVFQKTSKGFKLTTESKDTAMNIKEYSDQKECRLMIDKTFNSITNALFIEIKTVNYDLANAA